MISSKTRYTVNSKLLTIILVLICSNVFACDICGCYMGITPYYNRNSISLLYRYRSFNGYEGQSHSLFPNGSNFFIPARSQDAPITGHNGNPQDYEVYRSLEVRGKYFINSRLEINAILPYVSNSENYNGYTSTIGGLGDINVYAGYHIFQKLENNFKQQLIAGIGVKFPTGNNNLKNSEGIRYSSLTQAGTGSTDGFIYLNYLVGLGKFGASLNTSYKANGKNSRDESIANSTTSFLNIFYKQAIGKDVQVMPSLQFFYEYSGGEKYQGVKTGEHVMNNLMGGIGADIFYKNVSLNVGVQKNIWGAETDHPMSAGKAYVGLSYNF
ncbi:transporter [Pedobacter changchengzhani]|uniref:Transporter n=1 Tax=Pedobacter changchengzhani TaxID=2529274 RepID=A0A4R5MKZ1_9SPHI|nr:transporter [Pedobacter changchengzhani]TDG35759.1 transporter [Pedobacter changchengzhani]